MLDKNHKPIYITQPFLPSIKDLVEGIQKIYETKILTNMGPYHQEFEKKLLNYLCVNQLSLFSNGTIALITALKALNLPLGSEVITTPFTFAATPHSIAWSGLKPVFCDIDEKTMTIDPQKIQKLINKKTSAILGVHVYGFPCYVEEIKNIASSNNLRVIYDGAHAFSTKICSSSICNWGDITALSFHATKLFHTFEGGGLVCNIPQLGQEIIKLRNFGIRDEFLVEEIGLNGKMNEFQALVGLLNLDLVSHEQELRSNLHAFYSKNLKGIKGISIPQLPTNTSNSFQYFPVLIEEKRDAVYQILRKNEIFARAYFYPPCTEYNCYKTLGNRTSLEITYRIADQVLCLPFYGTLEEETAFKICNIIKNEMET